jgi:hypothetical protein
MVPAAAATLMKELHPLRLQYALFSDENPLMAPVKTMAKQVRQDRAKAPADNPFLAVQDIVSRQIVAGLDAWRDIRDSVGESMFLSVYGSPFLQAFVGIDPADTRPPRRAGKSSLHKEFVNTRIAQLKQQMQTGGMREGLLRTLIYVGLPRAGVDERGAAALRRIRAASDASSRLTLMDFKAIAREQFLMLLVDEQAAVAAIPQLIPKDMEARRNAIALVRQVLGGRGELAGAVADRLQEVAALLGVKAGPAAGGTVVTPPPAAKIDGAKSITGRGRRAPSHPS